MASLSAGRGERYAAVLIFFVLSMLAVGVSAASARPGHAAPPCFEAWWRGELDEARSLRKGPEALLPLRVATEMSRTAADPVQIDEALDSLRALPDTDPLVAAEIDSVLLANDIDFGRLDRAATRRARLGLVTGFLVAGPFGSGVPADIAADLSAGSRSRFRAVETGPDGALPLYQLMTPSTRTNAAAVFYVRATRTAPVAFRYGADDRAGVELDGRTIADPAGRHDMGFDQHAAFAELGPGWHRVVVRVEQEDGPWGLSLRLTDPAGRPLDPLEVTVEMPKDIAAAEREIASRREPTRTVAGRTIEAQLERLAAGGSPLAKARLAQDLAGRGLPDRSDAHAVGLAREAATAAPADVDVLWVVAMIDSDPARRREALEQIVKVDPTHPGALRRLAGYHLEYGRTDASLEEARRSLDACGQPDPYLQGWEALARDARGFPGGALATLATLVERYPHQVALLQRYGELALHEGFPRRARGAFQQYVALQRTDDRVRNELLQVVTEAGDGAAAIAAIEDASRTDPLDMNWRTRLAHTLLAQGAGDAALAQARAGLEISPGNPALLEVQGEALLAAGDERGAAASWKQALEVSQDHGLGDRIAALTGSDDTFGTEWTVSLDDAKKIEAARPVEGDPPYVVLSKTAAYRVRADGLGSRFQQVIIRVRNAEQAAGARGFSFSYSPTLERATVLAARLVRRDGAVLLAARNERPLLPDPEIRMWYDTQIVELGFPRLEDGDLIELRWRTTDRGPGNPIGDGYFGDVWLAGEEVPVVSSRIVLTSPPERPLAYRLANLSAKPEIRTEKRNGLDVSVIGLPSLPAYQGAPLAPPPTARVPYAVVGTIKDWATLGELYGRLIRDQAVPGPDVEDLVRQLTAKARSERDKVRALYDWVIENTRYVALELGIHALKPYDVPSVYHRRFGDCKDKATLLASMLRLAGVDARVALVRTRDRGPLDTTVPTFAAFDHAIVYVPSQKLWLDGTVQHHALGEVPAPDRNVLSLLVDPSGRGPGELVTIPEMSPADAYAERDEEIALEPDGVAKIGVTVLARGDDAGRQRSYFRLSDRPAIVLGNLLRRDFPDLSVLDAKFDAIGLDDGDVRYRYEARVERFGRRDGDGLSVPLGFFVPDLPVGRPAADRKLPIELPPPFQQKLTSRIVFPAGFRAQELPRGETLESPWGRVAVDVRPTRRGVDVSVDLSFAGGTVSVDQVAEFASFVERAGHVLEGRIVLRNPS